MRKLICHNPFLIVYLISFCFFVSHSLPNFRCLSDQSSALLQLKQEFAIQKPHLGDASQPKNMDTWKANSDCCLYDGVTCNMSTGQVIGLDLSNIGLQGPFHPNSSLFSLDHLQRLRLAFNNFNLSRIPSEFSQLSRLTHLNLSYSKFSGKIPLEFSLLINLVSLDFSGNYLSLANQDMDSLIQNMKELRELHLDEVKFYSSVPESLVKLSSLTSLSLSGCSLEGEFPKNIFELPNIQAINVSHNQDLIIFLPQFEFGSSLRLLDLSFTNFSGEIPNSIGKLKSLNILDLKFCELSGVIPSWVGDLTQLTYLDLSYNEFNSNLPATMENLSQLTYLDLSVNEFRDKFPSWLGNLSQLIYLDLSFNNFHGDFSFSLGSNLAKLEVLKLGYNYFTGEIPSSIGNLSRLTNLNISHNLFHGDFPTSLANVTQLLSLDLSRNLFAGPVPSHIFRNSNSVVKLDLSNNSFIGVVPSSLFTMPSLKYLVLDDNQFTGTLNIKNISSSPLNLLSLNGNKLSGQFPRSLSTFKNLRSLQLKSNNLTGFVNFSFFQELSVLDLSNNSLIGTLPKCLASSFTQLNLQGNNFHGNIPEICADECNLERLILGRNQFRGKLPRSLTKCRELRTLDLGDNQLEDTFPFFLQALPKLAVLVLRSNKFHGPIWEPSKFWGFVDLRVCDMSSNNFYGNLPSDYFRNWSATATEYVKDICYWSVTIDYYRYSVALRRDSDGSVNLENYLAVYRIIDLSNNRLYGEIPDSIGGISSLRGLNLSSNKFTGLIPFSLAKLADLESLDLSRNKLSGRIPELLESLTILQILNFSENQLTGPIPRGKQFNTFENDSYEGNMGLCGLPLAKQCENSEAPSSANGVEEESEDIFGWKSILRGYGCGLVTGLIAGLIGGHIIISKKLNWFVESSAEYIRNHIGKR